MPPPTHRKMRTTSVYFSQEQKEGLSRVSEATGISEAKLVRDGVDIILEIYQRRLKQLGLFKKQDDVVIGQAEQIIERELLEGMKHK